MFWKKPLWVPTTDCLNKALQPIHMSAEYKGAIELESDSLITRYRYARTGRVDWGLVMFGASCPPDFQYWHSPWLTKHRDLITEDERTLRTLRFPDTLDDFRHLLIACHRGWVGRPVPAIELRRGEDRCYIYLDGNHRMAAMWRWGHERAPVQLVGSFDEAQTLNTTLDCSGSPRLWWDTAWEPYRDYLDA